ncbi:MAG: HAD family hydrolase [Bacillota bacterium]
MKRVFSAVLFDLGGTLWDAFAGIPHEQVMREATTRAAEAMLGPRASAEQVDKLALGIVWRANARRADREAAAKVSFADPVFREDDIGSTLVEAGRPFQVEADAEIALAFGRDLCKYDRPFPETIPVLQKLRSARPELKIGIVSNTVVQPEVIDHYLAEQGILPLVDFRILSSELGWRKPHPAIYAAALSKAGVRPEEALFVGDRLLEDIQGPARLGIPGVLRLPPPPAETPDKVKTATGVSDRSRPLGVIRDLYGVLPLLSIE